MRNMLLASMVGLCIVHTAAMAGPPQAFDIEGGWVFPGYNDVRIPGDSGTKLSLTDDLSADSFPAYRARHTVTLAGKHDLGLLAAFLTMRSDGTLDRDVDFNGTTFPAGTPLESTFRFNSYRLTYRYRSSTTRWGVCQESDMAWGFKLPVSAGIDSCACSSTDRAGRL